MAVKRDRFGLEWKWRKDKRGVPENPSANIRAYHYNVYVLSLGGVDVAEATQTGVHGRDHYPWDWYTIEEAGLAYGGKGYGTCDSLKSCKDQAQHAFGLEA